MNVRSYGACCLVFFAKHSHLTVLRLYIHLLPDLLSVIYDSQVHWFSIVNSLLIVLFLTAMIAMILIRNLHRDILRYNRVPTDEEKAEEREETGWKVSFTACGHKSGGGYAALIRHTPAT